MLHDNTMTGNYQRKKWEWITISGGDDDGLQNYLTTSMLICFYEPDHKICHPSQLAGQWGQTWIQDIYLIKGIREN
ncbi:hypothetical protein JCM12294_07560 [Desulfocicer niacini]